MKSCTATTTIGITVQGFDMQVASASMPIFMTCASICPKPAIKVRRPAPSGMRTPAGRMNGRSEEHTSELQSPCNLVCRLLLEKKNKLENTKKNLTPPKQKLMVLEHILNPTE